VADESLPPLRLAARFARPDPESVSSKVASSANSKVDPESFFFFEELVSDSPSPSMSISSAAMTTTLRFFAGLPWRCLAVFDTATIRCSRLRGGGLLVRPELRVAGFCSTGAEGSLSAGEGKGGSGLSGWYSGRVRVSLIGRWRLRTVRGTWGGGGLYLGYMSTGHNVERMCQRTWVVPWPVHLRSSLWARAQWLCGAV
jgi:hypothetical protein